MSNAAFFRFSYTRSLSDRSSDALSASSPCRWWIVTFVRPAPRWWEAQTSGDSSTQTLSVHHAGTQHVPSLLAVEKQDHGSAVSTCRLFPPHLSAPKAGMAPGGSPRHRSDLFSNGDRPKVDRHYPSFTQEFKITVQHACWWPTCESEGLERRCRPARMSLTTSLHSTSGAPHSSSTGVHPRMPALLREPRILPRGSAAGLVRGSLGLGRVVAQISWPPPAHAAPSGVSRCTRPLYHRCWLGVGGAPGCGCDKRQRGRSDASPSS